MNETVYILRNPAMPCIVKIGRTPNLEKLVKRLSLHEEVPVAFEVYYARPVADSKKVEKGLHSYFEDCRVSPEREFFEVNPKHVLKVFKQFEIENITLRKDIVGSQEDRLTPTKGRKRNFRFSMVGIDVGATLSFVQNEEIQVTVADNQKVWFEGERVSLSQSALSILNRDFGKTRSSVRGPDFWVFENETLSERRVRMESED